MSLVDRLIICLPAFNEEKAIGALLDKIPKSFAGIKDCKIVVINDGSTDRTQNIAEEHGAIVLNHKQKKGLGNVFRTAIDYALSVKASILVSIDSDGQFDPREISKLLEPLLNGESDFSIGNRFADGRPPTMPIIKFAGNIFASKVLSFLLGRKISDTTCGFRAYTQEALLHLNPISNFTYTQETILELHSKKFVFQEIPITVQYFTDRKSRMVNSTTRYMVNSILILLSFLRDYKPLLFFGVTGGTVFLLGCIFDLSVIIHYIKYSTLTPYKAIGFLGMFLNTCGICIIAMGFIMDALTRLRLLVEKRLYNERKNKIQAPKLL